MAGEYNINLSDGTLLTTIYPLETNGPGNVSTPRSIIDINTTANTFTLAGDVTFRFVSGFVFDVFVPAPQGPGPNDGTYTVASAVYNPSPIDATTITVVEAIVSESPPYGQVTYSVPSIDTQLLLPGRGTINWGENILEDLVHLTENFANTTANLPPPSESLVGQQFWSTNEDSMYTYTSTGWSNAINASDAYFTGRVGINNAIPTGNVWLEVTGDIQANSQFFGSNQSASAPTFSFSSTQNMGMYNNAGTLSFAVAATDVLTLSSSGLISVATAGYETLVTSNNDIPNKKYVDDGITNAGYVLKSGDVMTGTLILSGDPTTSLAAATKQYVDTVAAGLDPKESVHIATTGPLTGVGITYNPSGGSAGTGAFTNVDVTNIDGHVGTIEERLLVKDQADARQNGIYVIVTAGTLGTIERSGDMDGTPASEVSPGNYTFVEFGTANQGSSWMILGGTATGLDGEIILNTDPINWSQVGSTGVFTGGTNINLVGNVINVDPQGPSSGLDADLWDGQQSNITSPTVNDVLVYDGTNWVNQPQTSSAPEYELLTATTGQKIFNTTISTSKFSGSPGNAGIQVFVNGVLQLESITFNVTGPNQITFINSLSLNDQVAIFSFGPVTSLGWNITIATYDGISFSVFPQDDNPRQLAFKPDGTKMYVIGLTNKQVYQYSLSTPWDLSTASYDGVSFSVLAQENNPSGFSFKTDGTKMYIVGIQTNTIYQYTLSTPWDLNTASYDSVSFSLAVQDASIRGISFKADGTSVYAVGTFNGAIYQYNLSTPWDISTTSYSGVSLSVVAQDLSALDIFAKPDGTSIFIMGNQNDSVYEYTLSTPWDLSTASYSGNSYSVVTQDSIPTGLSFKSDGIKMYMLGSVTSSVYQYTL